jgi:AcrR family transcriptional regulator
MAGLRERMKHRRREAILVAAEKLFRDRGYTETSIEEIAGEAEVSIGTLYRYFSSKSGVMHELVQPVIEGMREQGELIIADPPGNAEVAIAALFDAYRFSDDWKSLNLLQALGPAYTGVDSHLHTVFEEFETMIDEQLGQLVDKLTEKGKLNPALERSDLVFILFNHLYSHFVDHVSSAGRISYEETLVNMRRRLTIIMNPWV